MVRLSRTIFRRGTRVKLHDRAWARWSGAQPGPVHYGVWRPEDCGPRSRPHPFSVLPCVPRVRSRRDRFGRDFFCVPRVRLGAHTPDAWEGAATGFFVVVVTARAPLGLREVLLDLDLGSVYAVCSNGAVVQELRATRTSAPPSGDATWLARRHTHAARRCISTPTTRLNVQERGRAPMRGGFRVNPQTRITKSCSNDPVPTAKTRFCPAEAEVACSNHAGRMAQPSRFGAQRRSYGGAGGRSAASSLNHSARSTFPSSRERSRFEALALGTTKTRARKSTFRNPACPSPPPRLRSPAQEVSRPLVAGSC